MALRATPNEHMMTRHTAPSLCSGFHGKKVDAATRTNRSWLHGLERGEHRCAANTVYVNQDCAAYFWCTVVAERRGVAWYAVVERLQRAYVLAAASETRQRAALLRPRAAAAADDDAIIVGVHIRTVKRRLHGMLTGHAYLDLVDALRARHRAHYASTSGGGGGFLRRRRKRGLRFVVHCDGGERGYLINKPPVCPSHTCGYALALQALKNASDVEMRFQDFAAKRAAAKSGSAPAGAMESGTEALHAMHDLMMSDVLVLADSSFSLVAGMLGNMTAFAPACGARALPHWARVPCGHGMKASEAEWMAPGVHGAGGRLSTTPRPAKRERLRAEIAAAVRAVRWPPPTNRLRGVA